MVGLLVLHRARWRCKDKYDGCRSGTGCDARWRQTYLIAGRKARSERVRQRQGVLEVRRRRRCKGEAERRGFTRIDRDGLRPGNAHSKVRNHLKRLRDRGRGRVGRVPAWMAVIEHVPDATTAAVMPLTVQTCGVLDAKLTGKPELALAEIATDAVVLKMSPGALKLIV